MAALHAASAHLTHAWWSRGLLARALWPLAQLFASLVALRKMLYRIGIFRTQAVAAPVIVVGNLIAGGAGKTPTVIAIVELLRSRGWHPGIISRGYGRTHDDVVEVSANSDVEEGGDEPLLLRLRTRAPTLVGRDRVAAARELLRRFPDIDIIVSDDGLQHLRLPRCAQILVFDDRGAGNGWPIPAGPLREPLPRRVPPRTMVLYNADRPSTALPGRLARRGLAGAVALGDWWAGRPATLAALGQLADRMVVAAAGMANPSRFFDMLRGAGLAIRPMPLPDHFDFATLPWPPATTDVIVTEKDAVKLKPDRVGETRVWVAPLDFKLDESGERHLLAMLPPPPPGKSHGFATA